MGFVSKTMPQLNILSVGFTLKLVIAMAVMAGMVGLMEEPIASVLNESMDAFRRLLPGIRAVQ
jgi:flagellar biosynthesis protein FliR